MLARVADSLYWIGRYIERAEHFCRLSEVMLTSVVAPVSLSTTRQSPRKLGFSSSGARMWKV